MKFIFSLTLILAFPCYSQAQSWLCEAYSSCGEGGVGAGRSRSAPAQPTTNSTININPAAVPTQNTIGIEALYFKGSFDLALVKGLGRVGAAISPSNNEETFFGPPGFELDPDYYQRKYDQTKFPSQKLTLATAFNIYNNKKSELKRFELNLGVVGKYNKISNRVSPGGGVTGIAGPFTFGYSAYSDSFVNDEDVFKLEPETELLYTVETYSAGIFLSSVALDYSELRIFAAEFSKVSVTTASLLLKKAIITVSFRKEISDRFEYNYETKLVEYKREKNETFAGVQLAATKNVMVGVFYNYYLLHELSVGLTAFF